MKILLTLLTLLFLSQNAYAFDISNRASYNTIEEAKPDEQIMYNKLKKYAQQHYLQYPEIFQVQEVVHGITANQLYVITIISVSTIYNNRMNTIQLYGAFDRKGNLLKFSEGMGAIVKYLEEQKV